MARGNDERHNENRRPKQLDKWHRMGTVDRRQSYLENNPNAEDYELPTDRAQTFGRPYQTPSGKWGFEWEHRKHLDDIGDAPAEAWSNKKDLQDYISVLRNMDSMSSAGDAYYSSMRRDAAKEYYGDDYNAYRAWEAGEIPEDRDEPTTYEAPEGWVAWPRGGSFPPYAISNVEGTTHRLTQEFKTPSAARRAGRKFLNAVPHRDGSTKADLALPTNITGYQSL